MHMCAQDEQTWYLLNIITDLRDPKGVLDLQCTGLSPNIQKKKSTSYGIQMFIMAELTATEVWKNDTDVI